METGEIMSPRLYSLRQYLLPALVAGALVSCDNPQKRGVRELGKLGIQPSGQALIEAVSAGEDSRTGWLLDAGVDANCPAPDGRTPVLIATEKGDLVALKRLLKAGARPDAVAPDGTSPLAAAVANDSAAAISELLAAGANAGGSMPGGAKILTWAVREGRATSLRAMLDHGVSPLPADSAAEPLLLTAIHAKQRGVAEILVEHGAVTPDLPVIAAVIEGRWFDFLPTVVRAGANPDVAAKDGSTALARAVEAADTAAIEALLAVGADANRRSGSRTPLESAFMSDNPASFGPFVRHGLIENPTAWKGWLTTATDRRLPESAREILTHGAASSAEAQSVLHAAVLSRDGTFVKLLADFGTPAGTELALAAARGDREMTALLLACGAPPDFSLAASLDTPLSAALRAGSDGVAAELLEAGANLDFPTPEGEPLLAMAAATGCHQAIKSLLQNGADPNVPLVLPASPAFVKCVRPGVVRWLLTHDTHITPLMIAADSGVISSARELIRAGAVTETRTKKTGIWPINFASRRNDVKMMRLFLGRDPQHEERRIVIRISEQRARMFDSEGNEIFATRVSTGKKGHETPTGEYVITNKYRDWKSTLYPAQMPYFQRLSCGDFGLHAGNVPGYAASHGCIRVPAENARKLFSMTRSGDRVNIVP